jgi:hypothetical protein
MSRDEVREPCYATTIHINNTAVHQIHINLKEIYLYTHSPRFKADAQRQGLIIQGSTPQDTGLIIQGSIPQNTGTISQMLDPSE